MDSHSASNDLWSKDVFTNEQPEAKTCSGTKKHGKSNVEHHTAR